MRPLHHPHIDEITVQGILYAFSDPVRVRIFAQLLNSDSSKNCTTFVNIAEEPLPKSTLSQHFKILREAGLVRSERKGVELRNRTRCEELRDRFSELIDAILAAYDHESDRVMAKA